MTAPADQVWLDYSLARPSDAQLKAAKTFGVCRYLSVVNSLTTKKIIWQAEYDHLINDLGIAVHLNYEWYEGRMAEGNAAGQLDGSTALTQAKALGYPKGLPITFSDDTSGTALTAIKDYLNGVKTGMSGYYRIGYYGPRVKMDAVLTSGHAVFGWQPTAWSGQDANGNWIISKLAHLYQHLGGAPISGTDLNTVLREPPFAWYAGGEDMPLTQADVDLIWNEQINNAVDPTPPTSKARSFITDIHKTAHDAENAAKAATASAAAANTAIAAVKAQQATDKAEILAAIAALSVPAAPGQPVSGTYTYTP